MIFRRRRMESAGDVVAVRCMRPVFKYGVTVCSALCGGLLLYTVLFALFESRSASVFIMILSMIIFAFIGYFGAKMLLEKKLPRFPRQLGWIYSRMLPVRSVHALLRSRCFRHRKLCPQGEQCQESKRELRRQDS